jgi:hypothetical protein
MKPFLTSREYWTGFVFAALFLFFALVLWAL